MKSIKKIFKRPCRRCEKSYQPNGKYQKYCEKCQNILRKESEERKRRLRNEKK